MFCCFVVCRRRKCVFPLCPDDVQKGCPTQQRWIGNSHGLQGGKECYLWWPLRFYATPGLEGKQSFGKSPESLVNKKKFSTASEIMSPVDVDLLTGLEFEDNFKKKTNFKSWCKRLEFGRNARKRQKCIFFNLQRLSSFSHVQFVISLLRKWKTWKDASRTVIQFPWRKKNPLKIILSWYSLSLSSFIFS